MKNEALTEIDTTLLHKMQHYQMSLQLILSECQAKDLKIAQANAELAILRDHQTKHDAEKDQLRQVVARAEFEAQVVADSLRTLERECAEFKERLEASRSVFEALIESHRPFGVDRRKFRLKIMSIGQRTPNTGSQAVRHDILLAEARKVL